MAIKGDINGLNGYSANFDQSVPLSGLFEGLLNVGKFVTYPMAGVSWVGQKVLSGIKTVGTGVATIASNVGTEMGSILGMAIKGDFDGLNSYKANFDENVPLSGLFEGLLNVGKFVTYPMAGVSWVGSTIKSKFESLISGVSDVWTVLKDESKKIDEYASDGDVKALNKHKISVPDNTPISGVVNGVLQLVKGFSYIKAIFNWLGGNISDMLEGLADAGGDILNKFKKWLGGGTGEDDPDNAGGPVNFVEYNKSNKQDPNKVFSNPRNSGGSSNAMDLFNQYGISSQYSTRTINGVQENHNGIDLTKSVNSPVQSFTSGTVYKVYNKAAPNTGNLNNTDGGGFGNYVVIKDANGNYNYYAHMNGTSVKEGDVVDVGDKLGILGHTGRSTGPHLHYEVRKSPTGSDRSNTYNPSEYLKGNLTTIGTSSGSSSDSSGESSILDTFTNLTGFFSEFANRAWSGVTTGTWDNDYSSYFNNGTSSSSSDSSSDTSSYVSIDGSTASKKIWKYYKSLGIPDNAIAGIMANIQAESGLNSKNLQDSYETKLGYTDDSYTKAVDNGRYTNFVNDSAGYGLAQWTYWSLKQALLNYAKQKKKSIGDMDMQLEFLYKQLSESYPSTWKKMINASSPEEASTIMLDEFERPAVKNTTTRAGYAKQYYNLYAGKGGIGGARIKPRIIGTDTFKRSVGGPTTVGSTNYSNDVFNAYSTASSASKYINDTSNNNLTKAITMIIDLLREITGNTASTSSKLDMLENIKSGKVNIDGSKTINNITNNTNKSGSSASKVLDNSSGNKISRNQRIAEKIAQGI